MAFVNGLSDKLPPENSFMQCSSLNRNTHWQKSICKGHLISFELLQGRVRQSGAVHADPPVQGRCPRPLRRLPWQRRFYVLPARKQESPCYLIPVVVLGWHAPRLWQMGMPRPHAWRHEKGGHGLRVHAPWAPGSEADVRPGRNCEFPVRVEARPRTVDFVAMSEGRLVNDRRV